MSAYYYLNKQNEQQGPVAAEELIKNGVTPSTLVWKEGMSNWLPAKNVAELSSLFSTQSKPVQPPTFKKPNSFLVWSIITTLFCWPIGILAIIYSLKVDSWWKAGMPTEAHKASQRAKTCCLICAASYVILILSGIIVNLTES